MLRVESSVMTQVGYDETQRELDIVFTSGKRYRYFELPPEVYDALLDAESKGEFFNSEIRDVYACAGVNPQPETSDG